MTDMYAKLFSSLLSSSIWSEDSDTCKVWITLIALADREGCVFGSPLGIARICALPVKKVEEALERFQKPDRHSSDINRDEERDGARIERLPQGGWTLLNYAYYRDLADADVRRAQFRVSSKRYRQHKSTNVNEDQHESARATPSESSSESSSDATPDTKSKRERGASRRFIPPTIEELQEFSSEKGWTDFDSDLFYERYGSKGWMIGKNTMKEWKLAAQAAYREGWCRIRDEKPSAHARALVGKYLATTKDQPPDGKVADDMVRFERDLPPAQRRLTANWSQQDWDEWGKNNP